MAKNHVQCGHHLNLVVPAGTKSGDPVVIGQIAAVAEIDADATTNKATIDTEDVYNLSVKAIDDLGNSAVVIGDPIYFVAADTPKLSKKASGVLFGTALAAVTSGATASIDVKLTGIRAGRTVKGYVSFNVPGALAAGAAQVNGFTFNRAVTIIRVLARVKTLPGATTPLSLDVNKGAASLFAAAQQIASTDTAGSFKAFTPTANTSFAAGDVLSIDIDNPGSTAAADLEVVVEFDETIS